VSLPSSRLISSYLLLLSNACSEIALQTLRETDTDATSLFRSAFPRTLHTPELQIVATSPNSMLPAYPYLIQQVITKTGMLARGGTTGDATCASGVCKPETTIYSADTMSFHDFKNGGTASWTSAVDGSGWAVSCGPSF
jgi:hypothetical protein